MSKSVGRLETVELRKIWEHEAKNFTTWLADNLDVLDGQLSELELDLELESIEKSVGPFSADILATARGDSLVVIENQLNKTNHTHLGQILTYAVNVKADAVIWISPNPRPEHTAVINWLSNMTPIAFHLVKVQAFKIGESDPAPLFSLVSGSDEITKGAAKITGDLTKKQRMRLKFWEQLLEKSNAVTNLFSNWNPTKMPWMAATTGKPKTKFVYDLMQTEARVKMDFHADSIDESDKEKNNKRYEKIAAKKDEIEQAFGGKLTWDFKEDRKVQRIYTLLKGGLADEDKWNKIQDEMVATMDKFTKALLPHVKKL